MRGWSLACFMVALLIVGVTVLALVTRTATPTATPPASQSSAAPPGRPG